MIIITTSGVSLQSKQNAVNSRKNYLTSYPVLRIIHGLKSYEKNYIFSHRLSRLTRFASAQIRIDLMVIGYSNSQTKRQMNFETFSHQPRKETLFDIQLLSVN